MSLRLTGSATLLFLEGALAFAAAFTVYVLATWPINDLLLPMTAHAWRVEASTRLLQGLVAAVGGHTFAVNRAIAPPVFPRPERAAGAVQP